MDIWADITCLTGALTTAEAGVASADAHLFVGTQERPSSVAFEVLLPAESLQLSMMMLAACVCHVCIYSVTCVQVWPCLAPSIMIVIRPSLCMCNMQILMLLSLHLTPSHLL